MKEPVSQDPLTQLQVACIIVERDRKLQPFGWYLEPAGYYAPVFKRGSAPPEPLTAEEAMEKGWKPVYSEYIHTTLAPDNLYLVATGETHNGLETYTRHERRPPPLSDAEGPLTSADYAFGVLDGVASVPGPPKDQFSEATQRVHGAQPLGFMSPKQLKLIADPDHESGVYIPLRKTAAGNFTLPLYASTAPTPAAPNTDLSQILWDNEAVMSLNAELRLTMDQLVKLARAMGKS